MIETDAMIGGEESGGYAFKGNVPERDGILAGLYFLDLMVRLNKNHPNLLQIPYLIKVGAHYYDRIDTSFTGRSFPKRANNTQCTPQKDWWTCSYRFEYDGWLQILP